MDGIKQPVTLPQFYHIFTTVTYKEGGTGVVFTLVT